MTFSAPSGPVTGSVDVVTVVVGASVVVGAMVLDTGSVVVVVASTVVVVAGSVVVVVSRGTVVVVVSIRVVVVDELVVDDDVVVSGIVVVELVVVELDVVVSGAVVVVVSGGDVPLQTIQCDTSCSVPVTYGTFSDGCWYTSLNVAYLMTSVSQWSPGHDWLNVFNVTVLLGPMAPCAVDSPASCL